MGELEAKVGGGFRPRRRRQRGFERNIRHGVGL
jgi:hypothetical protein